MTTPRRPLSEAQLRQRREAAQIAAARRRERGLTEAQLRQRREAAQAAAARRRERGLTEAELAQRRAASIRSQVVREERAQTIRAEAWALPSERSERRIQRRELNAEAREVGRQFTRARIEGRLEEAAFLQEDVRNANRRALQVRGITADQARRYGLLTEDWGSKGIQSVLRKLDNLFAKGFTAEQALEILERRAFTVYDRFREARRSDLMVLAREFYTRMQRLERMRRRNRRRVAA